jgi:hypothetical protein
LLEPVLELHHLSDGSGWGDRLNGIGRIGDPLRKFDIFQLLAESNVLARRVVVVQHP